MKNLTVNKAQKLYVIASNGGYSCLGFDVCLNRTTKLRHEIGADFVIASAGSKKLYLQYMALVQVAKQKNKETGFVSKTELIPEFIGKEGYRVQVTDCNGETRRFIIGKSTGFIPCHIEILKSNSSGGMSVMGYPFKSVNFIEKVR